MSNQETPQRPPAFDRVFWLKWVLVSALGWLLGWALLGEVAVGAAVGIMQWLVLRSQVHQAGWWIVVSALGWGAGLALATALFTSEVVILPGVVIGGVTGIAQWLLLRRWVHHAGWWVATSVLGWALGPILGPALVGAVVGAVTGFSLELLMRHPRPEAKKGVPIS